MKRIPIHGIAANFLLLLAASGHLFAALAQNETSNLPAPSNRSIRTPMASPPAQAASPAGEEKRFNLDFAGGSPRELVQAMEAAAGESINVIITDENNAEVRIPALKLREVTITEAFNAFAIAGSTILRVPFQGAFQQITQEFRFVKGSVKQSASETGGKPIWSFWASRARFEPPPRFARFYQLGPHLKDLTIDDITTAIQTAWKMLDDRTPAELSFHKETQLLIAVGEEKQLAVIDAVLQALPKSGTDMPEVKKVPRLPPIPVEPSGPAKRE